MPSEMPWRLGAGLAPVVWGGAPILSGIFSGLAGAMIIAIVARLTRWAVRLDSGVTPS